MYSILLTKIFFRCTYMYHFCTLYVYAYTFLSCTFSSAIHTYTFFHCTYMHIHNYTVNSFCALYPYMCIFCCTHILSMYVHIYSFFCSTYRMHFLISSNFLDDLCIPCYGVLTFIQMYNIRIQKVSPQKV